MSTATASYPFEVTKKGDDYVFTFKKAKLGLRTIFPMLWPSFILSCFLAYNTASKEVMYLSAEEKIYKGIFYLVIYTVAIAVGLVILLNFFRSSGTFTIGQKGVILNGTTYPYPDIQSIYVKSPEGVISNNLTYTTTTGLMGGATQLSAAAGDAIRSSIKAKNFKVCILFGQKEKVLASQISEITAVQLINKINTLA